MNNDTYTRTKYKLLYQKYVTRVLQKIDSYPFKHGGYVPYSIVNPIVAATFRVNKDGCHQILYDMTQAGLIRTRYPNGVEVLPKGRAAYQVAEVEAEAEASTCHEASMVRSRSVLEGAEA